MSLLLRIVVLALIVGLIVPLWFFPIRKVQAISNSSGEIQNSPFVSAPPIPFQISSPKFQVSSRLAATSILSTALSGSFLGSVFGLFAPSTKSSTTATITPTLLQPLGTTSFDFDGDGKADVARWQRASTEWKVKNSSNGSVSTNLIGSVASVIVPADYDGDTKTDSAVFNASTGTWTIQRSSDGTTQTIIGFGQTGDKPVAGDYDGDGSADAALWRPSNGTWYVKQSSNGATVTQQFGASGDIPVAGNYDGDSQIDYAVFRPSNGIWYVWVSSRQHF